MANRVTQVASLVVYTGTATARVSQVAVLVVQSSAGTIAPDGIASTLALGTHSLTGNIVADGIASTLAFGTHTLTQSDLAPEGIASTLTLGTPALSAHPISPDGIVSTLVFGTPLLSAYIVPSSIASGLTFGTHALKGGIVFGDGIASTLSFGLPALLENERFWLWIGNRNVRPLVDSMRVTERAGSPATASFRLKEAGAYKPLPDSEVLYFRNGRKLFAGFIDDIDEEVVDRASLQSDGFYFLTCTCTDYHRILQNRYISFDYRTYTSLGDILEHVVDTFLDGDGVGLATIPEHTFANGNEFYPNDVTVWDFLQDIARVVGRDVWIDYDRLIHCELRFQVQNGLTLRTADGARWRKPRVKRRNKLFRNVQGVRMSVQCVSARSETITPSGAWQVGSTLYTIGDAVRPRITLNGTPKNVIFDSEMGSLPFDFMVRVGQRAIIGNPVTLITAPGSGDEIVVEYQPQTDSDVVWTQDANQIAARAARSNTSGRVQSVHEGGELVTETTAALTAASMISKFGDVAEVTFEIDDRTTAVNVAIGDAVTIDSSRPFCKGQFMVVGNSFEEAGDSWLKYSVTAHGPDGIPISSASDTRPIKITTERPHGLVSGQTVSIYGSEGNTNANVSNWPIVVESTTLFRLPGTRGNGTYTGGGYVISGIATGLRAVDSVSGSGQSPVVVTTENPHGATEPAPGENPWTPGVTTSPGIDHYNGINGGEFPSGSVGGISGSTASNGTGHTLIPSETVPIAPTLGGGTETTGGATGSLLIGPPNPAVGGIDIESISGDGTKVSITTIDEHGLSTDMRVLVRNVDEIPALDGVLWPITVTGVDTLELQNSSGITGSATQGTIARVAGLFASALGDGVKVRVTASQNHLLTDNQYITIPHADGFAAIVSNWHITTVSATVFDLQNSALTGTSSDVWFMPWPISNGTGTGGQVGPNLGLPPASISGIDGNEITTENPHGIETSENWPRFRITIDGNDGTDHNCTVNNVTGPTTVETSCTPPGTGGTGTPGGSNGESAGGGRRTRPDGPGREGIRNLHRRTRARRNRTVERATFVLASAIPGYASGSIQVGTNLTNEYVVANDGVFLQVIVFFKSPPQGGAIVLDLKANGVSILDGSQLVYPDGQVYPLRFNNFSERNLQVSQDDRLTLDVISVGEEFAGCDGTVTVLIGTR